MTDWKTLPMMIDVSRWQGAIDWDLVLGQPAPPICVFLKSSERTFEDPYFRTNRSALVARDVPWIPYIFLRPDDNDTSHKFAAGVIDDPSVPVALDWEDAGVSSQIVEDWIDFFAGRPIIIYYGKYPPAVPSSKIARYLRWLPHYTSGEPNTPPVVDPTDSGIDWRQHWLIWQWTDKGQMDGITANTVDMNRLAPSCSVEQFKQWYRTGSFSVSTPPPVVVPQPVGNPIKLIRDAQRLLGVEPDGWPGKLTNAAVTEYRRLHPDA
jgi:GH25 family lysozyme M1 (1,4-beta-N-acetylmuramidase)